MLTLAFDGFERSARARWLTVVLAATVAGGCRGARAGAQADRPVTGASPQPAAGHPFARVHHAQVSNYPEPAELVVTGDSAWRAAWGALFPNLPTGQPVPPAVDFARDVVLLVAAGPRSSGGYDVRVDAVDGDAAGGLVVRYTVASPGAGCLTTQATTSPVDVVRTARPAGPVRFVARRVSRPC